MRVCQSVQHETELQETAGRMPAAGADPTHGFLSTVGANTCCQLCMVHSCCSCCLSLPVSQCVSLTEGSMRSSLGMRAWWPV